MSRSVVSRLILSCLVVSSSSFSHAQSPAKISTSQLTDQRDVIVILRDQMADMAPAAERNAAVPRVPATRALALCADIELHLIRQ